MNREQSLDYAKKAGIIPEDHMDEACLLEFALMVYNQGVVDAMQVVDPDNAELEEKLWQLLIKKKEMWQEGMK